MIKLCSQVHGIVWDTIQFVEGIITTEMNSATDNPVSNCYTIMEWHALFAKILCNLLITAIYNYCSDIALDLL